MPVFTKSYKTSKGKKLSSVAWKGRKMGTVKYRNRKPKNKTTVSFGLGLPKKAVVAHKYVDNVVLTSTTGALTTHTFSCNGMFDPDNTGTGHQPMYFDQFAALYNHYHVIGSRIKVTFVPTTSGEAAYEAAVFLNDDTTVTPSSIVGIAENSFGNVKLITPSSTKPIIITKNWSCKKWFGGSVLSQDSLGAAVTANPTEQVHFTICMQAIPAAETAVCNALVEIEFITMWDELKDIASS